MANDLNKCIINELLKVPFSCRSTDDKDRIMTTGRPQPRLPNLSTEYKNKDRIYFRNFNISQYDKIAWLTGSVKLEKLFCWPCILFGTEQSVWNKEGYSDLKNLSNAVQKHERSQSHIRAFVQLQNFEKIRLDMFHNVQLQDNVSCHNEMVRRNREILKRLIDATCFLALQELSFQEYNESEVSLKKGNYFELLKFLSIYDPTLQEHLKSATTFKGTSNTIQSDLIKAISAVVAQEIKKEISDATYVAILLDETSDIINQSQLSTVLRYVHNQNAQVYERFISFSNVSTDRSANSLFKHVLNIVDTYDLREKLVAQSYDGATVMVGEFNDLKIKVQEFTPNAMFVHCFSRMLNHVLSQSASKITECCIFFQTLSELSSFFSKATWRLHALNEFAMNIMPGNAHICWNFSARLMNTVKENRMLLLGFFHNVIDNASDWESNMVVMARGFLSFLSECNTIFFLHVFSKIYAYTDVLYNTLQMEPLDIMHCADKVEETKSLILNEQNRFDAMWSDVSKDSGECYEVPLKRIKHEEEELEQKSKLYLEIIDNVSTHLTERFGNLHQLQFISLIDPLKFQSYKIKFPTSLLENLKIAYSNNFDYPRLRNELIVLYSTPVFSEKYPHELAHYMKSMQFHIPLAEVYKLAVLVLTIPSTTVSKHSFSALKRISFQRFSQGQERSSGLALLSIEREKLCQIRNTATFYDDVIDEYCAQERRMQFQFK